MLNQENSLSSQFKNNLIWAQNNNSEKESYLNLHDKKKKDQ